MKDMKMRTKMIIGFAIPILLTILNVAVGMVSVSRIDHEVVEMLEEEVVSIKQTMKDIGADEAKAELV